MGGGRRVTAGGARAQAGGVGAGRVSGLRCSKAVVIDRVVPIGEQRTIKRQFMKARPRPRAEPSPPGADARRGAAGRSGHGRRRGGA